MLYKCEMGKEHFESFDDPTPPHRPLCMTLSPFCRVPLPLPFPSNICQTSTAPPELFVFFLFLSHDPYTKRSTKCSQESRVPSSFLPFLPPSLHPSLPFYSPLANPFPASQELHTAFQTLVSSPTQRGLLITIDKESLTPLTVLSPASSSFDDDLRKQLLQAFAFLIWTLTVLFNVSKVLRHLQTPPRLSIFSRTGQY